MGMKKEIKVSVLCLAYNHEECIRDALEGFVSQRTNFGFEVLIHDDASTDKTAEIIREYEEKYPEIIKPIYQNENQYSKGNELFRTFLLPLAQGKYLAFCEGDDYWVDSMKLQKQYDFMEKNPEYMICANRAVFADHDNGRCRILPKQGAARSYSTDEIIVLGGLFFATASFFMRRNAYIAMPPCFYNPYFADWQLAIYGSIGAGCYCLQDVMTVYNNKRKGSYTERSWMDKEFRNRINEETLKMLERINKHYGYRYNDAIQNRLHHYRYRILKVQGRLDEAQGEEYAEFRILDQVTDKMKRQ